MFHQLIERDGVRKAVYSRSDLEYMQRGGWKPITLPVAAVLRVEPHCVVPEVRQKRKYTRKAK